MYFSTFMNLDQDCAWPGYRRICYEMKCSSKTIKKYVDELVEKEYLLVGKIRELSRGGDQELNKYIVNIPTKVLSEGKHLIEKVLSARTKGTFPQGTKVLSQGKHNNNRITKNNNYEKKTSFPFWNDNLAWERLGQDHNIKPNGQEGWDQYKNRIRHNLE